MAIDPKNREEVKPAPKVRTAFLPISGITYIEHELAFYVHAVRIGDDVTLTFSIAEDEERAKKIAGNFGEVLLTQDIFPFLARMEASQASELMKMPVHVGVEHVRPN